MELDRDIAALDRVLEMLDSYTATLHRDLVPRGRHTAGQDRDTAVLGTVPAEPDRHIVETPEN